MEKHFFISIGSKTNIKAIMIIEGGAKEKTNLREHKDTFRSKWTGLNNWKYRDR